MTRVQAAGNVAVGGDKAMAPARSWQQLEGGLVFASALCLYLTAPGFPWWVAVLVFFAPDLSFLAYLRGPKVGSVVYNAVHIYGFGAAVLAIGMATGSPGFAAAGALWLGHSGFDRMLGYGLKLPVGFDQTHLGRIGRGR